MKILIFALVLLCAAVSCKKEDSEVGDPKVIKYSFEIVDKEDKSIFENNKYKSDSVLFKIKKIDGSLSIYKPGFRIVSGKIISEQDSPSGTDDKTSGNSVSTIYVYLNKNDTDTLRIVMFPSSVRDIGGGKYNFPTKIQFFYNEKLNQEYDFVKSPELLQSFWRNDDVGQIITLKK